MVFSKFTIYKYFGRLIDENPFLILKKIGKMYNFSPSQHEAFLMATLEKVRLENGSTMDRIQSDVVFSEKKISPAFFSALLDMLKVRDEKFGQIVKILTKSCKVMNQNPPILVGEFFLSGEFFRQFININKVIDELWMLRKEKPEQLQEWKIKHKQIFKFRTKLFKFLEIFFGRDWVNDLIKRAEQLRVRVWPLDDGLDTECVDLTVDSTH
jgi:hypothetical protein